VIYIWRGDVNMKKIIKKLLPIIIGLSMTLTSSFAIGIPVVPGDADTSEMVNFFKNYIEDNYKFEVTDEEIESGIYSGLFDSLDRHSKYYTKEDFDMLITSLEGNYVGIGVYIMEEDGYLRVTKPIEDGPASRAGIKQDDVIIGVDGENIKEMSDYEAISKIKGIEGTTVIIRIKRPGVANPMDFEIVREKIIIKNVEIEKIDNIGYMKIAGFNKDVSEDVKLGLIKLLSYKVDGIVIDLRDNPGGLLSEVVEIADYFLPRGREICTIDYKSQEDDVYYSESDGVEIPTAVIINNNSASASEILAGSLQQNGAAVIVGETSYGKGTVQEVINLYKGDGFKLTIAEYKVANDTAINKIGVIPDIKVVNEEKSKVESYNNLVGFLNEKEEFIEGEYGLNVLAAQQRLNILGYVVKETGVLSPDTANKLGYFQKHENLTITKTLNKETKDEIRRITMENYELDVADKQLDAAKEAIINNSVKN
jgi:carboxyl-terminal processing protease